jgi:phospholipid/cholesterol/gamma-HCH transport system substrate-binding protein
VKNKNKEVVIGVFATIVLVLLYFGWYFLKGVDFFANQSKYYAIYDNIDQLAVSNPVLVNGYPAGRVSDIQILPEKQNRVLVEFEIDAAVVLGDSTRAILNSDFLGSKSILLNIGRIKSRLKPRDTVRAEVAKGLTDILAESAVPVADNLQTTLRKFNIVIDNLAISSTSLNKILAKMETTPDVLNGTLQNANSKMDLLGNSFKAVADNLSSTLVELKPTIANFRTLSDSLKKIELNKTLIKTQQTLTGLNQTLAKLNKGDNTASKLLTEDTLYVNFNKLLVSLDSLTKHFNNNPKHFLAPLGKSQKKIQRDKKHLEEERKKAAKEKK